MSDYCISSDILVRLGTVDDDYRYRETHTQGMLCLLPLIFWYMTLIRMTSWTTITCYAWTTCDSN